jgi:hypothetical protein
MSPPHSAGIKIFPRSDSVPREARSSSYISIHMVEAPDTHGSGIPLNHMYRFSVFPDPRNLPDVPQSAGPGIRPGPRPGASPWLGACPTSGRLLFAKLFVLFGRNEVKGRHGEREESKSVNERREREEIRDNVSVPFSGYIVSLAEAPAGAGSACRHHAASARALAAASELLGSGLWPPGPGGGGPAARPMQTVYSIILRHHP